MHRTLRKLGVQLERIVLDIKDFEPAGLACLGSGQPWVCLGKHLCGAATDYALLCMVRCAASPAEASSGTTQPKQHSEAASDAQDQHSNIIYRACTKEHKGHCPAEQRGISACQYQDETLQNDLCQQSVDLEQTEAAALGKAEASSGLQGFGIATCCHHRCSWEDYVGRSFFQEHSMTEADFQLLSWMTGLPAHAARNAFPLPEQCLHWEGCLLAIYHAYPEARRCCGVPAFALWAQAGQCAGMAARPRRQLLAAASRKAAVTAT